MKKLALLAAILLAIGLTSAAFAAGYKVVSLHPETFEIIGEGHIAVAEDEARMNGKIPVVNTWITPMDDGYIIEEYSFHAERVGEIFPMIYPPDYPYEGTAREVGENKEMFLEMHGSVALGTYEGSLEPLAEVSIPEAGREFIIRIVSVE